MHIGAGLPGVGIFLETRREDLVVGVIKPATLFGAEAFQELRAQAVRPGDHEVRDLLFNVLDADPRALAVRRAHDDVHTRQRRIGNLDGGVDGFPAESQRQQRLDSPSDSSRVLLARHENETREEASERVPAEEEFDPLTILQVQDADHCPREILHRALEQFLARVGLYDVHQGLATMPGCVDVCAFEYDSDFMAQQGDVSRARAVGHRRQQPDEAPFADGVAALVIDLHADVIEESRAMHRRAGIGLGQDQPVSRARHAPHLGREFNGRGAAIVLAEDSEPRAFHRVQKYPFATSRQRVLAITEKGEMIIGHPVEQRLTLGSQQRIDTLRPINQQL